MHKNQVSVYNLSRPLRDQLRVEYCTSFPCRLRGLTFRRKLAFNEGLLLVHSRQGRLETAIHMLGVRMELTVVWIDENYKVVDVRKARPWRLAYLPERPARYVLEVAANRRDEFEVGDELRFDRF
jgi:uncharacterized membrane protein (UPF0127 family)